MTAKQVTKGMYLDFSVQVGQFFIIEGQVATQQGIQQYSHAPDVCLKINKKLCTCYTFCKLLH